MVRAAWERADMPRKNEPTERQCLVTRQTRPVGELIRFVLGPDAMRALRTNIRGCPAPMEVEKGGHFVQEHGERIARAALLALNDSGR